MPMPWGGRQFPFEDGARKGNDSGTRALIPVPLVITIS